MSKSASQQPPSANPLARSATPSGGKDASQQPPSVAPTAVTPQNVNPSIIGGNVPAPTVAAGPSGPNAPPMQTMPSANPQANTATNANPSAMDFMGGASAVPGLTAAFNAQAANSALTPNQALSQGNIGGSWGPSQPSATANAPAAPANASAFSGGNVFGATPANGITAPRAMDSGGMLPQGQSPIAPDQLQQATAAAGSSSPMGPGGNISGAIQNASDAAYKNAAGYLDPQFANQENTLKNTLVNQGVPQNSEAWNKAMDDFQRQKTFAYSQAQSGAQAQGLTAQNQIANQLLTALGINTGADTQRFGIQTGANTAANQLAEQANTDTYNQSMGMRQQDINEMLLQQQNPLTMYNSLTNGANPQQPNFTNTPGSNVGGTDIASIIAQAMGQQNNTYNAQTGAANSANSGMATILAALISDRRFKRDIVKIGMHTSGVPLYTYNYIWGEPGIGVMADELEKVRPDAVHDVGGIKVVNYGAIS